MLILGCKSCYTFLVFRLNKLAIKTQNICKLVSLKTSTDVPEQKPEIFKVPYPKSSSTDDEEVSNDVFSHIKMPKEVKHAERQNISDFIAPPVFRLKPK